VLSVKTVGVSVLSLFFSQHATWHCTAMRQHFIVNACKADELGLHFSKRKPCKRSRLAGYLASMGEMRNAYKILVGKPV
jgi:hypothetical protein